MPTITCRVPQCVDDFLEAEAEKHATSKSFYLRQALAALIEQGEFAPTEMARQLRSNRLSPQKENSTHA